MNREQWLFECMTQLRFDFDQAGFSLPENIRVTCGWPSKSALAVKRKRVGESWSAECSGDKHFEVFVSPAVSDSVEVLAILVHELIHTAVGLECKHKGPFKECALAIGLEGKMVATVAGDELKARLRDLVEQEGAYPHAELTYLKSSGPAKQNVRQLKVICTDSECLCICRMSAKWINELGCPTCACGSAMAPECEGDTNE